jgi:hypothetical protein
MWSLAAQGGEDPRGPPGLDRSVYTRRSSSRDLLYEPNRARVTTVPAANVSSMRSRGTIDANASRRVLGIADAPQKQSRTSVLVPSPSIALVHPCRARMRIRPRRTPHRRLAPAWQITGRDGNGTTGRGDDSATRPHQSSVHRDACEERGEQKEPHIHIRSRLLTGRKYIGSPTCTHCYLQSTIHLTSLLLIFFSFSK